MINDISAINRLIEAFIIPTLNKALNVYNQRVERFGFTNDMSHGNFTMLISTCDAEDGRLTPNDANISKTLLKALGDMGFNIENIDINLGYYSALDITFKNFEFHNKLLNDKKD